MIAIFRIQNQRMRTFLLFLILFIALWPVSVMAQDTSGKMTMALVAERGKQKRMYAEGAHCMLHYRAEGGIHRARGRMHVGSDGRVVITRGRKGRVLAEFAPDSIRMLRRANPVRNVVLAALGTTMLVAGAAKLDDSRRLGAAVSGILLASTGTLTLIAMGAIALTDHANSCAYEQGWRFSLRRVSRSDLTRYR